MLIGESDTVAFHVLRFLCAEEEATKLVPLLVVFEYVMAFSGSEIYRVRTHCDTALIVRTRWRETRSIEEADQASRPREVV